MDYVIGIDGGGTKTHCLLADCNGNKLHECFGGPSNFLMLGTDEVAETIYQLVDGCLKENKLHFNDLSSLVLGTTGAGRRSDAEVFEKAFNTYLEQKKISFSSFSVDSDARVALEGAFSGKPGSILIAGTGSIMFGKNAENKVIRVGGFGRFIGDEGSGFMLGKKGLILAAKSYDGRGPGTLISDYIYDSFGIKSPEDLITEIYTNKFDIASVAPLVLKAAENGDKQAMNIIDTEAEELLLHIGAMLNRLGEETLKVAFIGGILSNDTLLSRTLKEKTAKALPSVTIQKADHSPAYGAVLLALKKSGLK